jgi:hypothetical protein
VDRACIRRFEELAKLGRNKIKFFLGPVHLGVHFFEQLALLRELDVDILCVVVQVLCNLCDFFKLLILFAHEVAAFVLLK